MAIKRLHIIRLFAFMLLLMGGSITNEAWAIKVTYHILTLPFSTKNLDHSSDPHGTTDRYTNIRVEALKFVADGTSFKVAAGLPAHYKSPLAKNFKYFDATTANVTKTNNVQIYEYMTTKYTTYVFSDYTTGLLADDADITTDKEIYVIYEYDTSNSIAKLDGTQGYNIKLGDRFLCFNKSRANRPGAILASNVTEENLNSNDFTIVANSGFSDANSYFHFRFLFEGEDPYNITLRTAYNGDVTFPESDKALNKTVLKWYKGASLFCQGKDNGSNNLWLASDDDKQYTQTNLSGEVTWVSKPGFYRGGINNSAEMNPIWNSFAMLNALDNNGYVFMGTKINTDWQPKSGKYFYLTGNIENGKNPRFQLKEAATAESTDPEVYEIKTYTFKVKTPSGEILTATREETHYKKDASLITHVPNALKRKYITFTGTYSDEALTSEISTFADADDNSNIIWLKYTSSMPFEALPINGSYANARWYTMRMNGDKEDQYIVKYDATNNKFNTGGGSNSNIHEGENSAEAMVAFLGDPFELRIISRKACEDATAAAGVSASAAHNRYIGCATTSADATNFSSRTSTSDKVTWEIDDDGVEGTLVLREFGTYSSPKYIGWHYGGDGNPIYYKTTGSRIKVVELEKKNYVYHIINSTGNIAVKMTEAQDVGTPLRLSSIPELIRSPFLALLSSTNINYYWTKDNADAGTSAKTHASYDPGTEGYNVYVKYDGSAMATALSSYRVHFHTDQFLNVRLNGQYLSFYKDGEGNKNINSKETITSDEADSDAYKWRLEGQDPYNMKVYNEGAYRDDESAAKSYINTTFANNEALSFDVAGNAKSFVALSGTIENTFEVMAATGDNVDVATDYFHIGRNTDNSVKMFNKATYPHGYGQIRFVLTLTTANVVYYHLIDKEKTDLLQVRSRHESLYFPVDYRSPLVGRYHYYPTKADADAGTNELTENSLVSSLTEASTIVDQNEDGYVDVYVTYDTNDIINLEKGALYLMRFQTGDSFQQEDGHDNLTEDPVPAVYPYCNGDCNFFVYGQDEYELQQQGAASTRTRWVWYVESAKNDPYHVKICSRQQEIYPTGSENKYNAYFRTYLQNYGGENHVVTTLAWPGITGEQGTDYMVMGSVGLYQLVTSNTIHDGSTDERRTVNSFEQYWKTYDTVKNKLLKDILEDKDKDASPTGSTLVPNTPASYRTLLTGTGEGQYGFHSYPHWAYAKRFNGYNKDGETKKGWEQIEHWYQTVNMGDGYFDFVETTVDPALILLDQHGWEIMRKPLPSSPDDPNKAAKYNAIRPYDSPMVEKYYFWTSFKKMTNYHQYYNLGDQITVNGEPYTSTSLTNLPPFETAVNVKDSKGNLNDQYVTYIVKDEYANSYSPSTKTGDKFLIQQGDKYVYASNESTFATADVPTSGGMAQAIITANGSFGDEYLWYVKPNATIDNEQGYGVSGNASTTHTGWKKDYTDDTVLTGYPSNGFDPYNIQITNVKYGKKFATNATSALLDDGVVTGNSTTLLLDNVVDPSYSATKYYDNSKLAITNTTFMAVQDANGNMQLMPRFDQDKRIRNFNTLEKPVGNDDKLNQMKTKLFRPQVYNYLIIDDSGNESLRYKSGGDLAPQTPKHFKSPLAKDFKYYSDSSCETEITKSFASATLTDNKVYVRYAYNEDADENKILKGKWFTMQLNEMDAKYDEGIKQGTSKPATIDKDQKVWQWKLLKTPHSVPDPYAVQLFNRNVEGTGQPAADTRYAILSHTSGGYALAQAGLENYTYTFLNGAGMNTTTNASLAEDKDGENASGFTSTSCTFHGTDSQVKLINDVVHTFNYHVYTNGTNGSNEVKYGIEAISENQTNAEASQNEFVPVLPEPARSPMLELEEFLYYEAVADMGNSAKELQYLYGLYEDDVYVRYKAYNPDKSEYKVPNDKGIESGHVARGADSNDASLILDGKLLYNIIWYNDNMMYNDDGTNVKGDYNEALKATPTKYVWQLEGNDPYAIKIKSHSDNKYIGSDGTLSATAQTFMLIPKEDYSYGVLAVTGAKEKKLTIATDDGSDATNEAVNVATTDSPTQFIIFSLATHKVIYHLVIAKTATNTVTPESGCYETIPYYDKSTSTLTTKNIPGSTQRDLSTTYQLGSTINGQNYSYDAGHISLGDLLEVPSVLYRPNVTYDFYVEGVYDDETCETPANSTDLTPVTLNSKYKGRKVDHMGDDTDLLGKTVRINIVYTFNGELNTNNGLDFVRSVSDNKWYTFETSGDTPWMSQFTNAWGLEVKEGRGTHYTNDYLWSPLGDPYGFRMYNRYIYKNSGASNSGEHNRVMTTTAFAEDQPVGMTDGNNTDPKDDPYNVYELLSGSTDGYFYVHPVINDTGTKYYLRTKKYDEEGKKGTFVILSETPTNFTFGLSDELVKPYFNLVGYVGGLKENVAKSEDYGDKHINVKSLATAIKNGTPLTALQLMDAQTLVYDDANLVPFTSGYYRMHSPDGIAGIDGIRYASGYTHKREESDGVPMHFYEVEGTATQFNLLKSKDGESVNTGFFSSASTQGDIPIPAVENDPASIFYITGTYDNAKIQTQGLYVKGEIGKTADNGTPAETIEAEGVRAKAQMTSTVGSASALWIMDIGGGVMLIHDRSIPRYRKYLSYDQTDAAHIYDLKLTNKTHTDHAKWCLQPANNLGLKITTHSGGDEGTYGTAYNYSTFYAPFDILLPDDEADKDDPSKNAKQYRAFICDTKISPWNDADLHPRPISWYNIEENSCPSDYRGSIKFVPAGTPVILAAIDDSESGYIKVTIPTSAPSLNAGNPLLTTGFKVKLNGTDLDNETRNNTLTGQYLEQKLAVGDKGYVYVFGLPYTGTFTEENYASNGDITATLPSPSNSGWGFYKNINPNKEASPARASWTRNNWYILGNRVYYRAAAESSARGMTRGGVDFVPVVFDWEDVEEGGYGQMEEEELTERREYVGDGCVYDMQGRRVATEQQVLDGTWKQRVAPGIYIINGKKLLVE